MKFSFENRDPPDLRNENILNSKIKKKFRDMGLILYDQ